MANKARPLAVGTGASTGIGYELAKCCARQGFDLTVVADEPEIAEVAKEFEALGAIVTPLETNLATIEGVDRLVSIIGGRPVDAPLANAGRGLGKGFVDQNFDMAQTPVQHYTPKFLSLIEEGKIDPTVVITDRARLEDGPELYKNSGTARTGASRS